MNNTTFNALSTFLIAVGVGAVAGFFVATYLPKSEERLIRDFYATEVAVSVSPHSLRTSLDKGERKYAIVDLRSAEEYRVGHIPTALNIPAYKDKYTSAYDEVDRIVAEFQALPEGKEIVTYCYSIPCMTSRKVGHLLAEEGVYVKHLNIGWNEWRYYWKLWNHEHEWATANSEDYVVTGEVPGTWPVSGIPSPCTEGDLGC